VLWWPNYVISITLLANIYSIIFVGQTLEDEVNVSVSQDMRVLRRHNFSVRKDIPRVDYLAMVQLQFQEQENFFNDSYCSDSTY
jgi:hypothetical protein